MSGGDLRREKDRCIHFCQCGWKHGSDFRDHSGYEVQYSTSKTFASEKKTVTKAGKAKVSAMVKGLKKGKTYYVRIRTYKTVGKKKYYSAWSTKKSIKITK